MVVCVCGGGGGSIINAKMVVFFSKVLKFYSTFLIDKKNSIFDEILV
jgi:hypothetical protein